jgi:hypothetical protein
MIFNSEKRKDHIFLEEVPGGGEFYNSHAMMTSPLDDMFFFNFSEFLPIIVLT